MRLFKVLKPGLFTVVQDLGRWGFQRYGVPTSGAMDSYSLVAANLLVGNDANDACLEITLLAPQLEFLAESQVAVTGAARSSILNQEPVPCWQTLQLHEGDVLSFEPLQNGCRAYLAVRGGIDVPIILHSRSTYVRGGFGGFQGRPLKTGDVVHVSEPATLLKSGFLLPQELVPKFDDEFTVEAVLGPQSDYFTSRGLETFLSNAYAVTAEADRMGYRLDGPEVEQKSGLNIVSDAIPVGAVQVPTSGRPIIAMRDAQTTGGYPTIAAVISPDLTRLGQAKPNTRIRFSRVSLSRAHEKFLEYRKDLSRVKTRFVELELQGDI